MKSGDAQHDDARVLSVLNDTIGELGTQVTTQGTTPRENKEFEKLTSKKKSRYQMSGRAIVEDSSRRK
jgi:hypothetical protein